MLAVNVWCSNSDSRQDGPLCIVSACRECGPLLTRVPSHVHRPGLLEAVPLPGRSPLHCCLLRHCHVQGHQHDPHAVFESQIRQRPHPRALSAGGEERPQVARPAPAWLQPLLLSPLPCKDCLGLFRLL